MSDRAEVVRLGVFDMQVCVPEEWTDEQIEEFANTVNPPGGDLSWHMLGPQSAYLNGDPQRNPCMERSCYVHVRLEC